MNKRLTDLKVAVERIARAETLDALRSSVLAIARDLFNARAVGLRLLTQRGDDLDVIGVPEHLLDDYRGPTDALTRALMDYHAPVHELQLSSPRAWQRVRGVSSLRAELGLQHYLVAPFVQNGAVSGMICAARDQCEDSFGEDDLSTAAAISVHVTERIAVIRRRVAIVEGQNQLTARESQIVDLVVLGLTNGDIGAALGISSNTVKAAMKSIFQKLDISSRVELVLCVCG
jgi:DNA-binding NarL/FixJ family response regulator